MFSLYGKAKKCQGRVGYANDNMQLTHSLTYTDVMKKRYLLEPQNRLYQKSISN